ncbi:MAG: bifunctional glycosyl transferase/isomerase [Conexibacter sp.]|nr:bifunctional glycosyl transferase/isomerase [Conexibacter sp.]
MRIAMVSEHASPLAALGGVDAGGQNVHVAALATAMARQGASVVVHTRRDDPGLPRHVTLAAGATVDHVDAGPPAMLPKDALLPHMDAFAEELVARWREDRPDVVHAHFWMSGYAALRAARALGIPVVHTFHALGVVKRRYQGDKDTSPPQRLAIERDILQHADHVVATCTDEVFELVRLGGTRGRLTVIPCGVDLDLFRVDGRRARRRPGLQRLVCLGRLVERKGVGNAISALPGVPGVELVVAGGPARAELDRDPEARRLHELARTLGVADRVDLRGRLGRAEVAALLRSADAVVCVPWYEPFGIVPLEAMACGTPVVASAVGGMIDTVVDGTTGIHVPPRDPERLAEALASLLGDEARRAVYGEAGVARAQRLYGWPRVAAATLDVYARVAARRGTARPARRITGGRAAAYRLVPSAREHLAALSDAIAGLEEQLDTVEGWGERLADRLLAGGRLLAVGNGGSAAEAQHLTAELVGRYQTERAPLSAICLHGDTSSLTAIANDYGPEEAFARQVRAHGRPGDVLIALSTSGRSPNVVRAVEEANELGMTTWALTGGPPNPLADACDDALRLGGASTATTQELHLVALHMLCGAIDRELALRAPERGPERRSGHGSPRTLNRVRPQRQVAR